MQSFFQLFVWVIFQCVHVDFICGGEFASGRMSYFLLDGFELRLPRTSFVSVV